MIDFELLEDILDENISRAMQHGAQFGEPMKLKETLMKLPLQVQSLKNKINVLRHPGHLPAPVERYCAGIQEALEVLGLWE